MLRIYFFFYSNGRLTFKLTSKCTKFTRNVRRQGQGVDRQLHFTEAFEDLQLLFFGVSYYRYLC